MHQISFWTFARKSNCAETSAKTTREFGKINRHWGTYVLSRMHILKISLWKLHVIKSASDLFHAYVCQVKNKSFRNFYVGIPYVSWGTADLPCFGIKIQRICDILTKWYLKIIISTFLMLCDKISFATRIKCISANEIL